MHISEKITDLFLDINEFSGNEIKNKEVILAILELSGKNEKVFNDLIFAGKYVDGMLNIINKKTPEEKTKEYLSAELTKNLEKIVKLLKDLSGDHNYDSNKYITIELPGKDHSDEVTLTRPDNSSGNERIHELFRSRYYKLDQQSLLNLISLTSDLACIKKYLNVNPS